MFRSVAPIVAIMAFVAPVAAVAAPISVPHGVNLHTKQTPYVVIDATASEPVTLAGDTCGTGKVIRVIARVDLRFEGRKKAPGPAEYYSRVAILSGGLSGNCTITFRSGHDSATVTVSNRGNR